MSDTNTPRTMRAMVSEGHVGQMLVKSVPRPVIRYPTDIIVKITTAAICGTDLHTYHGIIGANEPSWHMGHEGVGVVIEVGAEVQHMKGIAIHEIGNILNAKDLGGTQAEYVRVPVADQVARPLPGGKENDNDYVLLSDIWPTSCAALDKSGFKAGNTVAVFGCGPVGLLGSHCALLRGPSKVYAIDHVTSRLAKAKSIGAIPIDLHNGDPATQILKLEPNGVNRTVDLAGYGCINAKLEKQENYILNQAVLLTAVGGGIGVIGVYYGTEPSAGSPKQSEKLRYINFDVSTFYVKGLTIGGGPVNPESYFDRLLELIASGKAKPSFIVDRINGIEEAEQAYRDFDEHEYGKPLKTFSD